MYQKIGIQDVETQEWTYGMVTAIDALQIQLDGIANYDYQNISAFRYRQKDLDVVSKAFIYGGAAYAGIMLINGAINGDDPIIPENHAIAAASMFAFGWGVHFLARKTFTMEKNRIEYINMQAN